MHPMSPHAHPKREGSFPNATLSLGPDGLRLEAIEDACGPACPDHGARLGGPVVVEDRNRTVYLAGPMRGVPLFNFPAFDDASARARALGWWVISPAEMDRAVGFDEHRASLDGFDLAAAQARDVSAIMGLSPATDALALLPGWECSTGAQAELALARWRGLAILDARTFEPLEPQRRETVLEEAARLTSSDRQRVYGHPRLHFACTAALVTAYLIRRGWTPPAGGLLPEDWPQIMSLDKTARQAGNLAATGKLHRDSLADQAGYARTAEMLGEQP